MPPRPTGFFGGTGFKTLPSFFGFSTGAGFPPIENLLVDPTVGRFPLTQGGGDGRFFTNHSPPKVWSLLSFH
jgi:hypothetical protein